MKLERASFCKTLLLLPLSLLLLTGCGSSGSEKRTKKYPVLPQQEVTIENNESTIETDPVVVTETNTTKEDTNTTTKVEPLKLTIEGSPKCSVSLYSYYHFKPVVNKEGVTFDVLNKPPFLSFDTTTGELSGVVEQEGVFSDITIRVKDAEQNATLPPFTLTVTPKENLSLHYAKAIQPPKDDYYWYLAPERAIDGNKSTYNHTQGDGELNWLELSFPEGTAIKEVVVFNRNDNTAYRLDGAKLYLCQKSIESNLTNLTSCQESYTLSSTTEAQIWENNQTLEGAVIVIKAKDDNNLHVAEVEVYGTLPNQPAIVSLESDTLVPYNDRTKGSLLTTVEAIDYQGDALIYTLDDTRFTIDENGNIYANEDLASGSYLLHVTVSDGKDSITRTLTIEINSEDALEKLLQSGDIFQNRVTTGEILDAILAEFERLKSANDVLATIYADRNISYVPPQSSQYFQFYGDLERVQPLMVAQSGEVVAVVNNKYPSSMVAFGSNPIYEFDQGNNLAFEENFKSVIRYLFKEGESNKTVNVYPGSTTISSWLEANFDGVNVVTVELNSTDVDLTILSKYWSLPNTLTQEVFEAEVQSLLHSGVPLLYLHDSWGSNSYSEYIANINDGTFPYAGVYLRSVTIAWSNYSQMYESYLDGYTQLFNHLKAEDYQFDWSKCKDSAGNYTEDGEKCSEVEGLSETFLIGAERIRGLFTALDEQKRAIFDENGSTLAKLYILLADHYRQDVSYPMDKVRSDQMDYFKSLYSDYAVYNTRKIVPVQPDMGNFSRSDFSHITPVNKEVKLTSKVPFRSSGAYALPGQTFRVTREDESSVEVEIFVNSIRVGATHEYLKDGYTRPKFLQTAHVKIKPHETIEMTSLYGGPIQIGVDKNEENLTFTFENVGEHPYWQSSADNDAFAQALDANAYDWAEISTESFEVHSTLEKMQQTIANMTDPEGDVTYTVDKDEATGADVAYAIQRYTANHPFGLAGYKGIGIDPIEEADSFAQEHNITVEIVDFVKHMNADQASCGYGCSGNPYDAYWAFAPLSHGDIHEIGHGLETKRFLFAGWEGHALTNPYAFYTKSIYFKDTGKDPNCKSLPFKDVFDGIKSGDMATFWTTSAWDDQVLFTIEAMMGVQAVHKLENGWHLLTRLHMLDRAFKRATLNSDSWESKKVSLGFGDYTRDEAKAINNNDWMLIALSVCGEMDFRDYLAMWGLPYSDKAAQQVASFGYEALPRDFFVPEEVDGYCKVNSDGGMLYDSVVDMNDENATYPY